ncbi:sigma factor-like helix-turn-helix DNA-binding protein [Streptomyces sp. NPDC050534]|uniref:sigma factor-like helix-turn-helix DNA-binding protein n=1 Tax=Streptomyces sp. NPDC050534 TaxID=3365625 RepID=UPI0037929CED
MFLSLRRRGEAPVRASCPQQAPGDAPQQPIELVLPLEYTAFCLLHQDRYLHYAHERTQDAWMSRQVVEAVLGNLATIWPTVISSPRPSAVAWQLLDALITSALRSRRSEDARVVDAVHRQLPRGQADAVILRCRLQLSDKQAAELMGVEAPAVASQLRMAQRALSGPPAGAQP